MSETKKPIQGIKAIAYFRDGTGRCCDRCGAFIKNVTLVTFKDDTRQSYGTECIHKVLSGDNSLQALWNKNLRLLSKWQSHLRILSLPVEEMPVDPRGYYGRGFYFVADEKGKPLTCGELFIRDGKEFRGSDGCMVFHPTRVGDVGLASFNGKPTFDMRNCGRTGWEANTLENWKAKCMADIEAKKNWLNREIARIEKFLARVLEKGLVSSTKTQE